MKKLFICLMTISMSMSLGLSAANHETAAKTELSQAAKEEKLKVLTARLEEINAIDKSNLSRVEKRALRKEVVAIKKEAKVVEGGLYISAGVLLLIVILLIILL